MDINKVKNTICFLFMSWGVMVGYAFYPPLALFFAVTFCIVLGGWAYAMPWKSMEAKIFVPVGAISAFFVWFLLMMLGGNQIRNLMDEYQYLLSPIEEWEGKQ